MATTIEVLSLEDFDFSNVPVVTAQVVTLVKAIPVVPYREGYMTIRLHRKNFVYSDSKVDVVLLAEAPSSEDPSVEFIGGSVASSTIVATDPVPTVYFAAMSAPFPACVQLRLSANQGGTIGANPQPLTFTISIELTLRD